MQRNFIEIDGHRYFLSAECDVGELSKQISAAVQQGGEMVEASVAGGGTVRFLSSPGTYIAIESTDEPDSEGISDADALVGSVEVYPDYL